MTGFKDTVDDFIHQVCAHFDHQLVMGKVHQEGGQLLFYPPGVNPLYGESLAPLAITSDDAVYWPWTYAHFGGHFCSRVEKDATNNRMKLRTRSGVPKPTWVGKRRQVCSVRMPRGITGYLFAA